MSCILRINGTDLILNDLLKVNLIPSSTWEKGTPILSAMPEGKKYSNSGASYVVSEADFDEFEVQKYDAINFLERNNRQIMEIMHLPGIEGACLDFGINSKDVPVQCDHFPSELVKLSGKLGLGIELSQYS